MTNTLPQAGIDLIKRFEGLRLTAYLDAVGIRTIGYGHTSMAGSPRVTAGMTITEPQAEAILLNDLKKYEKAVRHAVEVPLNDNQYAALVSFCYNVGPGNFRKSSALRYLNQGHYDQVPRRLALWNKAGGRVLRGLVRRRKAEGELFATPVGSTHAEAERDTAAAFRGRIEPERGKPIVKSRTAWAAGGLGAIAFGELSEATDTIRNVAENATGVSEALGVPLGAIMLAAAIAGLAGWIVYDRWWKAEHEAV
ncbi:MAG: lysozyme [Hyphomicrobiales bacterium]|nr:lysozyme [Hyphomicrobiales bacterium]